AEVVGEAPELTNVLDHHRHAVRVALAEVTAGRVVGAPSSELDDAARHVCAAFALLAETVLLELEHRGEGERVVRAGDVDVLGLDARLAEYDLARVVAGDA